MSVLAKTYGASVFGVDAHLITIEVNVVAGTKLFMVGLPDNAVKESEQRIESALKFVGFSMPRHKTIVNLAPADLRKGGSAFDLPIALGILHASEQVDFPELGEYLIMGELALDGVLRPIRGALPIAIEARKRKYKGFILPKENALEAAIVSDIDIIGVESLEEAIDFLTGAVTIAPTIQDTRSIFYQKLDEHSLDFADVKGQENMKRALEIAAAGGHNVIMIGAPGSGKTMLARRLPSILPPLTLYEALETTKIHSVAGLLGANATLVAQRPFRSPHNTISDVALVGGGGNPMPGEISLAHNGVLFLDELPEFKRSVLEVMRQPLEERRVTISRAKMTVDYPAGFMLVASMNPCPCGYLNHPTKECSCSSIAVQKYMGKISGPLLDRIDLHVEVTPVSLDEISSDRRSEPSSAIRERVIKAREIQRERYKDLEGVFSNAMLPSNRVRDYCSIDNVGMNILKLAVERLGLSARAYDRILKVSRTIADISGSEKIDPMHVAEAIQYRSLDRDYWNG